MSTGKGARALPRLSAAQRAVVAAPDRHLLVDAGAGSGKTLTVVQAICHQMGIPVAVDGEPIPPVRAPLALDQIAAITFTTRAAAELKQRIRAALRTAGMRDVASDVDAARIGTIHSFCGGLLRSHALRAGLRPSRRLYGEGDYSALMTDCARDALHGAVASRDVPGLELILDGRSTRDIIRWIAIAAEDTARLKTWEQSAHELRKHEYALLILARRAVEMASEIERLEGSTDFNGIITGVHDMLRDAGIRHSVQRDIRLLVLDEFQDVDPAQRDIAYLLGGVHGGDPAPTRLILVGDPKQSVYGFRRADVSLWNEVARDFAQGAGTILPLKENYRSKAAILALVDSAVGPLLDAPLSGDGERRSFEVNYAALEPRAVENEGDRAVEFLVVAPGEEGAARSVNAVRRAEAGGIARRIAELHGDGARFRDMAILLASMSQVQEYESALRAAGIPYYTSRASGFWESREVLDCVLALRAIRDPRDEAALIGFLKSPFISVRDDTLLALANAREDGPLFDYLLSTNHERPLLARAHAVLAGLGALRDRLPSDELISRLLFDSGYLAAVASDPFNGKQGVANIRKLLRLAVQNPDRSLGDFLRAIADERERGTREAPEPLHAELADAVTVSTIHGSKGLEWPVVFWSDLVRPIRMDTSGFLVGRHLFRVKLESTAAAAGEKQPDEHYATLRELRQQESKAEAWRLWYVAATRARKLLILSGIPLGKARRTTDVSPAHILSERFPTLGEAREVEYTSAAGTVFHAVVRRIEEVPAPKAPPVYGEAALAAAPVSIASPAGRSRLSATGLKALRESLGAPAGVRPQAGPGESEASAALPRAHSIATGDAVHKALERIDLDMEVTSEFIEDMLAGDADADDSRRELAAAIRAEVRRRVETAHSSDAWRQLAAEPSARRELSFTRLLPDGTAVNGAFDLAAIVEGGVRILDVKSTGEGDARVLAERYALQAAVYMDAARAITAIEDVKFTILTAPGGVEVDVRATDDVQELIAWVRGGGEALSISTQNPRTSSTRPPSRT